MQNGLDDRHFDVTLTHWGRVMHICVGNITIIGSNWLVAWSAPSHYLNQCWNIVNWTIRNKRQWKLNKNLFIFVQENGFENVWKMAAILSGPQCVNVLWVCGRRYSPVSESRTLVNHRITHTLKQPISHNQSCLYVTVVALTSLVTLGIVNLALTRLWQ